MAVEERLRSKYLYKIELWLIKIIPFGLAFICFINTTLSYLRIDIPFLSYLGSTSLLPLLFLYVSSYVFRFCLFHRLPLHYILINWILNVFDEYIGIPFSDRDLYSIYLIITFIFITVCRYYNVDEDSEEAAYLIGYIAQKMHKYLIEYI